MSSLRLAKLAQLMKEAKEQYFNLYNDMNDSIYVEQKGRTVGDVEVLPGKTLSGCITSSNLTVYYTNLMGGKDSKVISSNELITLLPSLTTKKGELSPTLNISKVLIDISIKKYNSANKLAGMRKVAEGGAYGEYDDLYKDKSVEELYKIISDELDSMVYADEDVIKAVGYYLGKSNGTEEGALEYCRRANPSKIGGVKTLKDAMDSKRDWMYGAFKKEFNKGRSESYRKLSEDTAKDSKIIRDSIITKFNTFIDEITAYLYKYKNNQTKDQALAYVKRMIYDVFPQGRLTIDEVSLFNNKDEKKNLFDDMVSGNYQSLVEIISIIYGDSSSGKATSGGSSRPQAKTGYVELRDVGSLKEEVTTKGDVFTYTIDGPLQFTYTWKNRQGVVQKGKENRVVTPQNYSGWNQTANNLNTDPDIRNIISPEAEAPAATTAPATPAAETAPAKEESAKKTLNPNTVAGVEAVLRRASASDERGLGGKTWFKNEKGRIAEMVSNIDEVYNRRLGKNGSYRVLAQMLVNENQSTLDAWFGDANVANEILKADRKDLIADPKGQGYQRHVSVVLGELNKMFDGDYADNKKGYIRSYMQTFADKKPAENKDAGKEATSNAPAAPAPNAGATPSTPATPAPATTPTTEASGADDGTTKKSSRIDPRIKKLAKLRRLRVRAQMEAAVEPSAKLGRSRVS